MEEFIETSLGPQEILHNPLLNKGTGFSKKERDELHLHGLLPPHISTIEEQMERRYKNFQNKSTDLGKYKLLSSLQDRNETLFYRLFLKHCEEMLPFIYTPTVGDASSQYSYIYTQNRGIYLSYPMIDRLDEIITNIPKEHVDVIVVTDGQRILGLGDLGIGGMAIPVGKLAIYTAFGGINPARTLPIFLDVGTNNDSLRNDPLYLGWRNKRIEGAEYDRFIDSFVKGIKKRFPKVLIQWEDFANQHAGRILEKYRNEVCSFNDDIQGTAATALSAILSAIKAKKERLTDQRIVLFGGGSAGIGIANYLRLALIEQGMSEQEALEKIYIIDVPGLIHTGMSVIREAQKKYAQSKEKINLWDIHAEKVSLLDTIKNAKATILIGASAQANAFSKEVLSEMAKHSKHPIILPLSNPTSKAEATPSDILDATDGRAIIATGSPFEPVVFNGKTHQIGQCNNVYIYPGIGLGVVSVKASKVTDAMFLKATEVLSQYSPILSDLKRSIFPNIATLRDLSFQIALAVAKVAVAEKVTNTSLDQVENRIKATMWQPDYVPLRRKKS